MASPIKTSFRLTGADGGALRGDVRTAGGARPAVVICHGFKGFKDWGYFPVAADRLARAGFTAVSFNFSGAGVGDDGETFDEPERFGRSTYSAQLADLDVVLQAVGSGALGFQPAAVGLLGHSMGGGVVILRAARDHSIEALVTWASVARFGRLWRDDQISEWRRTGRLEVVNQRTGDVLPLYPDILDDLERNGATLDVLRAARDVRVPWLIAHGSEDESVPVADAHELSSSAPRATPLILAHAGHTFGIKHPWNGSTEAFDKLLEATVDWFARHLL
ncbi:MAG: alpha/beta hydrolase family protein [Gammaproteobacteria bacterium]